MLARTSTLLPRSPHHPAGDLGALPEAGQLAPALSGVSVPNPGTPLPPGNVGLGGRVAGPGGLLCSLKGVFREGMGTRPFPTMAAQSGGCPMPFSLGCSMGSGMHPPGTAHSWLLFLSPRPAGQTREEPAQPHSLAGDPLGITGDLGSPWLGGQEEQERAVLGRAMGALTA